MTIKNSIISIGLIVVLAGCIDSGGDDEADEESGGASGAERISFTGLVADGYLDGATVCLDINENKECDVNDPTATSGEGGAFEITDATQAQRDQFPLLVEVVVGTTIDEDNEGVALTKPLTLTAPAGYGFVSPLSTMVQNEVEGGATASAAEDAVQEKLGTTLDLDSDYIAGKASGANADEYEQLHQVAQVTARVISDNMETLADAAEENNISLDDLISAIVDEVFDALDEITTKVEVIAADDTQTFDPDAVATEVDEEFVDLEPETIEEQVEQNQAEEAAAEVSIVDAMKAGGISWMWAEIDSENFALNADYGTIEFDASNVFSETVLVWNGSAFTAGSPGSNDTAYILKSGVWQLMEGGNEGGTFTANPDGSLSIERGTAPNSYVERLSGVEIDITGLNTQLIANQVDDGDGTWGSYLVAGQVFPAGSKGYQLVDAGSDEPYIFEDWNDCGTPTGGLCNFTYLQDGPGGVHGGATSFAAITSATAYTLTDGSLTDIQNIKAVEVAYYDNGDKVWAEIVTGGAVNYYKVNNGHTAVTLLGSATWTMVSGGSVAMELVTIPSLSALDSEFDDGNPVLALISGYIRNASHQTIDANQNTEIQLLNSVALAEVTGANFSLDNYQNPLLLADAGCDADNFLWDAQTDPSTSTFKTEAEFDAAVSTCLNGSNQFIPKVADMVDTTFVAKSQAGTALTTYVFSGYDSVADSYTGTVTRPNESFSFTWELEADNANDDAPTGMITLATLNESPSFMVELAWLSQQVNGDTSMIGRRHTHSDAPSNNASIISSAVFERTVDRPRSTMADLAAAGILDDSNINDGGNREGYIYFTDDLDSTGSITIYERIDPASCFTKETIPFNDNGNGAFTAPGAGDLGEDINVSWYIDANGNLYDDQWKNVPADPQPVLSTLDSNICPAP